MDSELVSIFICVYNGERFLRETLNSVINQTYKNLEIIIVDDCSTDATEEIINSFNDTRIKTVKNDINRQYPYSCNYGLSLCKGEYISHIDADDLWEPDKIEKQVEFLNNHREYAMCFTWADLIDESGNPAGDNFYALKDVYNMPNLQQHEMLRYLFDNANHLCHCAVMGRKEIFGTVGPYDVSLCYLQDFDYWLRSLLVTPIYCIEKPLTHVRVHENKNSNMDDLKWTAHNNEYVRIIDRLIRTCPNDLFLKTFSDKLFFNGEHNAMEIELEKAFVFKNSIRAIPENNVLAITRLSELLNIPEYAEIAEKKFGFTLKDLYALQTQRAYYEKTAEENLRKDDKSQISKLNKELAQISDKLSANEEELIVLRADNKSLRDTVNDQKNQIALANNIISEYRNSFFWKLTKPARAVSQRLKNLIAKNEKLLRFCIRLKRLIKSGPKGAVRICKNYIKAHTNTTSVPQTISKKQREYESNYQFKARVKYSILVPLYNTPKEFLTEMIASVKNQTYDNWELCLADGSTDDFAFVGEYCKKLAKSDKRILYKKLSENKGISENTNACIEMATGDYIALFDHDDILHPSALFEYTKVINEKNADFIYCDEDKFDKLGKKFYDAHFKPDFAPDNLRANNYICHFTVFKKSLLDVVGGFRKEFDGSQDHDLVLRLTEKAQNIVHIPKILYRWRVSKASVASDPYAKPYTITAGINAVKEHLERVGLKGTVESSTVHPNIYRIKYDIIGKPLVSIIIPNYNHVNELSRCINSIITKSTYDNYEIVIIENNSNEETFRYYDTLKKYPNVKVVVYKPEPNEFNYSAINNFGFKFTSGEHIILLNNDVEIISPDWIQEMLMYSQRSDVGAVGAMLYYPNNTIQHAGVVIGLLTLAGHAFKHFPKGTAGYFGRAAYQQNLSAVTAACIMMPRKVYEEVGGLDESFKVAFNDIDLCMRIRKAGYLIVFTPYCELYHYESISRGNDEDTPQKKERFKGEIQRFLTRWKKELEAGDPYYNPNLTLDYEDFSIK